MLEQLTARGLELDQKLQRALQLSASAPNLRPEDVGFPDSYLTLALYRLNSVLTHLVELDESRYNLFHEYKLAPRCAASTVKPGKRLCRVLDRAVELVGSGRVVGSGHFLKAVVSLSLDEAAEPAYGFGDAVIHNTFSAETLLWGLGHSAWTPLAKVPEVRTVLAALEGNALVDETSYLLALEEGRIVIRPASALGTYRALARKRTSDRQVALLTRLREQYGLVTPDELLELEDLVNSATTAERDLQLFFERHAHFLRRWEFRDVHPQVVLTREDQGPLIPDFILVDPAISSATIVDLKLPDMKAVIKKRNRDRFSALVMEARAQLLEYRDWFEEKRNRESLRERFGLELYRPRLGVVIGAPADALPPYELQKLRSRLSDVDVVTYGEIAEHARRRMMLVQGA